ncbi:CATRA conflict system CASPASE/TPR repeat-associated protein [Mycobacterium sp. NPDC051804]|uniref:CATRA conflict system CASPASE/TPR repeat-associated protein n=1 Tax=Mycobacterium sp. NPDC051804 TaxID=3364295 RepID=UPI00378FE6DF
MTAAVTEPTFYVFVFAPLGPDVTGPALALAKAWSAASKLGVTEALIGYDQPVDLPQQMPTDDVWFRIVAAKSDVGGRRHAIAFTAHDVAAVMMRLGAESGDGWDELDDAWREAVEDDDWTGALGVAQVYAGACAEPHKEAAADTARAILTRNCPAGVEYSAALQPGIALWQMERAWGRSLVALSAPTASAELADWCWLSAAADDVGALGRFLMHAIKLRFEIGVFETDISTLRDLERRLDTGLEELFSLHEQFERSGAAANELIDAQSRLGRAQGDAAGLLISITHLRDLGRTVQIAAHNLRAYSPEPLQGTTSDTSPFAWELTLAGWIDDRIGHEIAYLESCRERVGEAQSLTDLRLQQVAAAHARTANWLTVLQTSVVGSLLGALGVATAFGEHFEVAKSVRAAMMVLVAVVALTLPVLAVRWSHGYRWPELLAAGLVGAASGWAATAWARQAGWLDATPLIILAAAVLGCALFAGAASVINSGRGSRSIRN